MNFWKLFGAGILIPVRPNLAAGLALAHRLLGLLSTWLQG